MTPGRPGVRGYWQNLLARGSTHVRREHQELIREFLHEAGQDHPLDGGPYSPFPLTKSTVGFIELPGKPDQRIHRSLYHRFSFRVRVAGPTRMKRWSLLSRTLRPSFVHHVRGPQTDAR